MKKLLTLLTLLSASFMAHAQKYHLDVNNDGNIELTDALMVIDAILDRFESGKSYLTCPDDHHPHLIDLGLPSGTKWSCCNIGSAVPEGYGGYYAWGETEGKTMYNDVSYLYNTEEDTDGDGFYDNNKQYQSLGSDIAGTKYDVAHVKWGGSWMMPTADQVQELLDNCTSQWTSLNGINGRQFIGANGGSIFLPATGSLWGSVYVSRGSSGHYWTTEQSFYEDQYAYALFFDSGRTPCWPFGRICGFSVRPVENKKRIHLDANNDGEIELTDALIIIDYILGRFNPEDNQPEDNLSCPDEHHPHMIDLGLPSGTLWSCCNEEAGKPEDFGDYYQFGVVPSAPTLEQINELVNKCSYEWTTLNGVMGGLFTGPNGSKIFLPAAGQKESNGDFLGVGSYGKYWSSTPYDDFWCVSLGFYSGRVFIYDKGAHSLYFRFPVRSVSKYKPNVLSVWSKEGKETVIALADKPEVYFTETDLVIAANNIEVSYPIDNMRKLSYDYQEILETVDLQSNQRTAGFEKNQVVLNSLPANSKISVSNPDGSAVLQKTVTQSDSYSLSLNSLKPGIYVVNAYNTTYKILVR